MSLVTSLSFEVIRTYGAAGSVVLTSVYIPFTLPAYRVDEPRDNRAVVGGWMDGPQIKSMSIMSLVLFRIELCTINPSCIRIQHAKNGKPTTLSLSVYLYSIHLLGYLFCIGILLELCSNHHAILTRFQYQCHISPYYIKYHQNSSQIIIKVCFFINFQELAGLAEEDTIFMQRK